MNNNEFMNLLGIVGRNDNKRKQLIVLGAIAGLAITASYFLYLKKKEITKKYNQLKSKYYNDKAQIIINNAHILRLNNIIKDLQAKNEIKADKPDNNINSSTQETSGS